MPDEYFRQAALPAWLLCVEALSLRTSSARRGPVKLRSLSPKRGKISFASALRPLRRGPAKLRSTVPKCAKDLFCLRTSSAPAGPAKLRSLSPKRGKDLFCLRTSSASARASEASLSVPQARERSLLPPHFVRSGEGQRSFARLSQKCKNRVPSGSASSGVSAAFLRHATDTKTKGKRQETKTKDKNRLNQTQNITALAQASPVGRSGSLAGRSGTRSPFPGSR
ncbi:hypothetical protein SAMN05518848_103233 [Paenibacillus sp. PDC88]|nr:hypothetical protein SAMN05518848_103233 [Paenibacillus sp. PDC88]